MHCLLEISNDSISLKLANEKKMECALFFILGSGCIMFLFPILGMLFLISSNEQISFGTILVLILAWLISGYFIRENSFITFNDYHYFRDNEKEITYSQIEIYCVHKNEVYLIDEFENIRTDIDINE